MIPAAAPTANVVISDGGASISSTASPSGGRASTLRPCASTPNVDARNSRSMARIRGMPAASGGTDSTIALAAPSSTVRSSGMSATTPPSISSRPSRWIGG
jgi:hypothetical protein